MPHINFRSITAITLFAAVIIAPSFSTASEIEGPEDENFVGRSLGGNVRQGPGLGYDAMRSVKEGTWLTIVRPANAVMDGYDWFEVRFDDDTEGFMWGGILCSNGQRLTGVYEQCTN